MNTLSFTYIIEFEIDTEDSEPDADAINARLRDALVPDETLSFDLSDLDLNVSAIRSRINHAYVHPDGDAWACTSAQGEWEEAENV